MKIGIHPEWKKTTVICNGCGNTFESHSTVDKITVEICSNCHPFYTGKQKLVDVAGRVDKFRARQEAASKRAPKAVKPKIIKKTVDKKSPTDLKQLRQQLEQKKPAVETKH